MTQIQNLKNHVTNLHNIEARLKKNLIAESNERGKLS